MSFKKTVLLSLIAVLAFSSMPVLAELQNVEIGGEIRIRGRFWNNVWERNTRWWNPVGAGSFVGRALGDERFAPRGGVWSRFDWDEHGANRKYVEQRTVLNVKADFTDDVKAVMELDSYDVWGEDFRSNYITGVDNRANTADDVEFIKAYIETNDTFGQPLQVRIGRQLVKLGKGWLVDEKHSGTRAQPMDGIRLTYDVDSFTLDALWMKLNERSPVEEDGDVDLYGLYGTYKGIEALQMSAYWLLVRDAIEIQEVNVGAANAPFSGYYLNDWLESFFGVDDFDPTYLNTVGIRLFGKYEGFDYDGEFAYQFGNASSAGHLFRTQGGLYGDDDAEYDQFGGEIEVGYTFDMDWKPRVYVGGLYFDGEDNRDINFWQWLIGPAGLGWRYYEPEASLSFNRLFTGVEVAKIFDSDQLWSNIWQIRLGTQFKPTEKVSAKFQVAYLGFVDTFDHPRFYLNIADMIGVDQRVLPKRALFPRLGFWTKSADDELGWIAGTEIKYQYSKDLYFAVGWEHLFTGDGLTEGNYAYEYGFVNTMGSDDADADYFYWDTAIKF